MKQLDVVVKYFHPVAAGIETNILNTYSVLVEQGWKVIVHTSLDTLTEKNVLTETDSLRGIEIRRYHWGRFGFWPNIDWHKTDAVCLHNFNIVPHLQLMLKVLKDKLIGKKNYGLFVTPHGGYNPEWSVFPPLSRIVKPIYHFTIGALLINLTADGVRAVSEWEKQQMIKRGLSPKLVEVISNGMEDEAFVDVEKEASQDIKKTVKSWGKYLIQVGRVYPIKNYETTIRALPKLPKDINFVIIGPLDFVMGKAVYQQQLKDLATELGVADRVIFGGVIRGVDKYYAVKKAIAMVHMAMWESFCNVVHEGMSQGLVCFVADNTALPLLIKNGVNGYCISTHDDVLLAEHLNKFLADQNNDLYQKIRKTNRQFGLQHSWRSTAARMGEFYTNRIKK